MKNYETLTGTVTKIGRCHFYIRVVIFLGWNKSLSKIFIKICWKTLQLWLYICHHRYAENLSKNMNHWKSAKFSSLPHESKFAIMRFLPFMPCQIGLESPRFPWIYLISSYFIHVKTDWRQLNLSKNMKYFHFHEQLI